MSPDEYAQEFEGSFESAVAGSFYGRYLDAARQAGRIRALPYQHQAPVETFWDLGLSDATAIIIAQRVGQEIHVLDYIEASGEALPYYVKELQRRPYVYAAHWLPPDAEAREYSSGQSRSDIAQRLGLRPVRIVPKHEVADGIENGRLLFSRCYFDPEQCGRLLDCLAAYRKQWDSKRQTFQKQPVHDWSSHAADAFRYMAVALKTSRDPVRRHEAPPPAKGLVTSRSLYPGLWKR
jgi:hypothetical protein